MIGISLRSGFCVNSRSTLHPFNCGNIKSNSTRSGRYCSIDRNAAMPSATRFAATPLSASAVQYRCASDASSSTTRTLDRDSSTAVRYAKPEALKLGCWDESARTRADRSVEVQPLSIVPSIYAVGSRRLCCRRRWTCPQPRSASRLLTASSSMSGFVLGRDYGDTADQMRFVGSIRVDWRHGNRRHIRFSSRDPHGYQLPREAVRQGLN